MIKRVVIFGGHIQALGLARQVASAIVKSGELRVKREVILLVDDTCSVARFSRAVKRTIVYRSMDEVAAIVESLELPDRGTLLFPTNDEAVEFLSAHYDEYKERFALGVPEPEVIELFNNKRTAYRYAVAHNVPCPECWYPDTLEEVKALSYSLPYPVVVKPAIMYSFHATFGKKAFRCDNAEQLMGIYQRIADANYPLESILIQEFLAGGPKHLYSYGVMAVDGKPLASIQANRIRQDPMDFGNSTTFAITCDIPEIEAQSVRLLEQTKYFGLGEVEWMWDEKSQQYKFLEINTRAWKWHTLSNQRHFSFIGKMIEWFDCSGELRVKSEELKENYTENIDKQKNENYKENTKNNYSTVGWVERLTDYAVVLKEIMHGRMKLGDVIKSYKIPHESAVWRWNDPLPGIMYVLLSPILYIKRH